MIKDVEALRNSLSLKEFQRRTLGLRLADLYFDGATELGRLLNPTAEDSKKLARLQLRSVSLYEEALNGTDGFAPPSGNLKLNVQFQLARLYSDLNVDQKATPLWQVLVEQNELTELKREAALRLAERAEKSHAKNSVAEADKYYQIAISLCAASDLCSYAHYRRAWLFKSDGRIKEAINEMKPALFDSKNQVREEALRDYLVFLGAESSDGKDALLLVEELAGKLSRPQLFQDLSGAFYSAGNRAAGTYVLDYVNTRNPQLKYQAKLMEELYGLRQWDKFREVREQAMMAPPVALEKNDAIEIEKTLRRLTVQLDGERISQTQLAPDFRATIDLYLKLFPTNKERFKMIEGWLASESDNAKKSDQLKVWLANPAFAFSKDEEIKLREFRVANARKAKNNLVIIEELTHLIPLAKDAKTEREYRFNQAVAYFEEKRTPEAMPLLTALANDGGDTFTVKSRFLILDIFAKEKKYTDLIAVADGWLKSSEGTKNLSEEMKKGLKEWKSTREEAEFELAASQGQTPAALATFKKFCLEKRYLPKSCENAKVLSVQLKDQDSLLTLLQEMNLTDELAAEYEAAGFFVKSAEILEKKQPKKITEISPTLKLALLYELGGRNDLRDKALKSLTPYLLTKKDFGREEALIYETLKEANLLDINSLKLAWSPGTKLQIAEMLEEKGQGNAQTKKMLVDSVAFVGPQWTKLVMEKLGKLDEEQRKQKFYGARSQRKFETRLAKLKTFVNESERYYKGADEKSRVDIAKLMEKAQSDLAAEILSTPIPEGLDDASITEIKGALTKMAEPFEARAKEYAALYAAPAPAVAATEPVKPAESELPIRQGATLTAVEPLKPPATKDIFESALSTLHKDPTAVGALSEIQRFYAENGKSRLASYFQGRIQSLEKNKVTQ